MDREGVAGAVTRRAEELRSDQDEQVRAFFEASRHVAPLGNPIAGLVALSVVWPYVSHVWLLVWLAALVTVAGLQAVAAFDPGAFTDLERRGPLLDTNVLVGVVWGLLPWLDLASFRGDEVFRWAYLVFAFAVGAGAMGGLSVLGGLAIRVQVPLFSLAAGALLVVGQPAVAAGVIVFVVLMSTDMRGTSRILRELIAVRIESADLAADAETEARHDGLTGLLNRVGAVERIEGLRGNGPIVAMFVDLDHFKEVNDRLGHEAGDAVLVETARRLQGTMRPEDAVARLGGDEFLIVFERGEADLEVISRRLLHEVERPIRLGAEEASISASIGVTEIDGDSWSLPAVLREADHALYEAKRTGRQRIVWFDERLAVELEERLALEAELRRAVDDEAITALAQPAFDLRSGTVAWVEFTPAWVGRDGMGVAASTFVPLAEEMGLGDALTRIVLDHAALARLRWRSHPQLSAAAVSVRVAASRLVGGGLVDDVAAVVAAHGLVEGELQLVLTDTADIRDPAAAAAAVGAMREMGVAFVLGEFGGGHSTLRDLMALPIDVVTLHPRLVREARVDERLVALLAAVDHVAGSLGLRVAADGVDSPDVLAVVERVGLPIGQGDALGAAVTPEELEGVAVDPVGPSSSRSTPAQR